MSAEIIELGINSRQDIPAEKILQDAAKANLAGCVVIGWTQDEEFFRGWSYASHPEVLWLLEMLRHELVSQAFDGGE